MEYKAFPQGHFVHALAHEVERRKTFCWVCQKPHCASCRISSMAFINSLPVEKRTALKTFMELQILAATDTKVAQRVHWGMV